MFLKMFEYLMKERGLNKHTLSIESGIPYTTIDGFYKRGTDNVRLSTLQRLCDFFDVTLDYLIKGETCNVTGHEKRVIEAYRSHTAIQGVIDKLLDIEQ